MPTAHERGQSSKSVLKLNWEYPTYQNEKTGSGSIAKEMRRALSEADAFAYIAGNDPRPLLVLRECAVCNGTDNALLSKDTDNERTFLMSTWFHCVKLPVDVLQKDHPFYELFGHDDPEHLFVAMPDGSGKIKLESQTSRTELWDSMSELLASSYKKDVQPAVKLVQKSLDHMDLLDERLLDLRSKKNAILETEGPGSKKIEKLDADIAETMAQISSLKEDIAIATKLELKNSEVRKASAPAPAKG